MDARTIRKANVLGDGDQFRDYVPKCAMVELNCSQRGRQPTSGAAVSRIVISAAIPRQRQPDPGMTARPHPLAPPCSVVSCSGNFSYLVELCPESILCVQNAIRVGGRSQVPRQIGSVPPDPQGHSLKAFLVETMNRDDK